MPLAGHRMIPTNWSSHHAGTVETSMNASVTIGEQTGSSYNPGTDDTTATWSTQYAGAARIQAQTLDQADSSLSGQALVGRRYLVQVPFIAAGVRVGMRVKVLAAMNDSDLVQQDLWVIDIPLGSERFTRDLICSDNQSDVPSV